MRLSIKGFAVACALVWAGGILFVGLIHLARPEYGTSFLQVVSSCYPWFHGARSIGDALMGALDGLVDGLVGGAVFAWLYNLLAKV